MEIIQIFFCEAEGPWSTWQRPDGVGSLQPCNTFKVSMWWLSSVDWYCVGWVTVFGMVWYWVLWYGTGWYIYRIAWDSKYWIVWFEKHGSVLDLLGLQIPAHVAKLMNANKCIYIHQLNTGVSDKISKL